MTIMNTYTVRIADWKNDRRALKLVREAVFIREQGVPAALEWDELDANCVHLLAVDVLQNPIGTARLLAEGFIGRMAVLKNWRGQRVGSSLMKQLLCEARTRQMKLLALNAQTHAIGFYAKLGFQPVGKEFLDAGIPHTRMALRLQSMPG